MGSDVQEVIGSAIALSLLSSGLIPLWVGALLSAAASFTLLLVERVSLWVAFHLIYLMPLWAGALLSAAVLSRCVFAVVILCRAGASEIVSFMILYAPLKCGYRCSQVCASPRW